MKYRQILRMLSASDITPKKMVRIYFFTAISGLHNDRLDDLQKEIQVRLQISPEEFDAILARQETRWSERQEEIEAMFAASSWMDDFVDDFSRIDSISLDEKNARYLMVNLLSSVLQNASIFSCSNHLHKKDAACLLSMLENPAFLEPLSKQIKKPILDCARGIYPPYSDEFVDRVMALAENLSAYYLTSLALGRGGLLQTITGAIKTVSRMSTREVATFIRPCEKPVSVHCQVDQDALYEFRGKQPSEPAEEPDSPLRPL